MKSRHALIFILLCTFLAAYHATPGNALDHPDDTTVYKVVVNHEETYSIWPADRENPLGWNDAGKTGTKEECVAWLKELWDSMKPQPSAAPSPSSENYRIPTTGQNGRNLEITGPFDSDPKTTQVTIGGQPAEVVEESPRKSIVRVLGNASGRVRVTLKERNRTTETICRVVNVAVTAPKTNLMKGEKTTVTVTINGLEGIYRSVPLELVATGVINMDGGNTQKGWINPTDVKPSGVYTTTRGITGRQAGGFNVTATVINKPDYITLVKDGRENAYRLKPDGKSQLLLLENLKEPGTGEPLDDGEYVLEFPCDAVTGMKALMAVWVKKGKGSVNPGRSGAACNFSGIGSPVAGMVLQTADIPPKLRGSVPANYVQLKHNASENGFRVTKKGDSVIVDLENVKDPRKKGEPLEGEYVIETRCIPGTLIQTQVLVFKKGKADFVLPRDCQVYDPLGRYVFAGVTLDF